MHVNIIGAGPIGCYAGHLLAKEGFNVDIYEEHSLVGVPVRCTGIVTDDINSIIKLGEGVVKNTISNVKIMCGDSSLSLESKEIILDRRKFDEQIANLALDSGCKINFNSRYISKDQIKCGDKIIEINNSKDDLLIGADGPLSRVAKFNDLLGVRKFFTGVQYLATTLQDPNEFKVYIENFPGFAWIVPESESVARVGLMSQDSNAPLYFKEFIKQVKIDKILGTSSGLIPIYDSKMTVHKENVYLVGDAAGQVKATTGGGIVPSLKACQLLVKAVTKDLDYASLCTNEVGKQLKLHLLLRNILNKFKPEDYKELMRLLNKPSVKDLFKDISRERPSLLLSKLVWRQPMLLKYFRCLI